MDLITYLGENWKRGVIDHALRFHTIDTDGKPIFYVHPANTDGDTLDFKCLGGDVIERKIYPTLE